MNRAVRSIPVLISVLAIGVFALAGCSVGASPSERTGTGTSSRSASDKGSQTAVVASTDVWGDLAGVVGGSQVEVTSIIDKPDIDPHEYEANTRNLLSLAKASVVIENGGGYDDFVDRMLESAGNHRATVLNAVTISGKNASAGTQLNEHVWYDFPTVEKVVDQIEASYTKVDPADTATFRSNAAALKQKINGLERREADLKKRYSGQLVSITEPVPMYLLDAIGLRNKTPEAFSKAIEEDTDVPAKVLDQTLKLYSNHQVKLLAYNEQTSGPETQRVLTAAKQNNIPVVPVTETLPAGQDYIGWMSANLTAIGTALGQHR